MLKLISFLALTLIVCVLFFGMTDPTSLPVAFLMLPVILVFAVFFLIVRIVLRITVSGFVKDQKQRVYAILAGLVASMIMLFQSTGGIVWADIILMSLFLVIAYFYINKL